VADEEHGIWLDLDALSIEWTPGRPRPGVRRCRCRGDGFAKNAWSARRVGSPHHQVHPPCPLCRARGALIDAGMPAKEADRAVVPGTGSWADEVLVDAHAMTARHAWMTWEVARIGPPACWACCQLSFTEHVDYASDCIATGRLVEDCYRPGRLRLTHEP
jgi:hypothetical protein